MPVFGCTPVVYYCLWYASCLHPLFPVILFRSFLSSLVSVIFCFCICCVSVLMDFILVMGSYTTDCKISVPLSPGESWAAATASPWLALPPGASDCKEGRTSACPSPSHGLVTHTCTPLMYPLLHDNHLWRMLLMFTMPFASSQWWKCVCHSSPVWHSLLDLDTLSEQFKASVTQAPVKATTIVIIMLRNWTVTTTSASLENTLLNFSDGLWGCIRRIKPIAVNACCHIGRSDEG